MDVELGLKGQFREGKGILMDYLVHETAYRGESTIAKIKQYPIFVCGCGAIGSNIIYNMAKQGFQNITVIDNDRIEKHNIGTQTWGLREVNGKKVQIMRNQISMATGISIQMIDKELCQSNIKRLINPESIVVDGFDNFRSRAVVKTFCENSKIDCVHIGLSEHYAEIVWNEKYKIPTVKK